VDLSRTVHPQYRSRDRLSDHLADASFPTSVVPPPGLPIAGEILTSHTRSIDPRARPIRYAGGTVPDGIARLVRAKLDTFITI
jgi:hypothetical protein